MYIYMFIYIYSSHIFILYILYTVYLFIEISNKWAVLKARMIAVHLGDYDYICNTFITLNL